jgi:uncharacterized protein YndB with AHSA1/START domain/DNA-binding transcriptional ArsR family regulator
MLDDDLVFKALADSSRRILLDALFRNDGQTLIELQAYLPMTRFGTMKHLHILEEAGLIVAHKVGREKYHYLNPVPIQQNYDRWVSKYAQPFSTGLSWLKRELEEKPMQQKHTHMYQIFIRTTPEKLWQALTDGDLTSQYYFGTRFQSSLKPGEPYDYMQPDGQAMIHGDILECDPPTKLVTTFKPLWVPDAETQPITRVTFEIEPQGTLCKLTLIHDDLIADAPITQGMIQGWAQIFSGLKTLLETGVAMN